jgi:hypothetical protein
MPKIRDLGINAIPETMRPPEIGGGGGCHGCTYSPADCRQTYICDGTSPAAKQQKCWCERCRRPSCDHTTHEARDYQGGCVTCPDCGQGCNDTTFKANYGRDYDYDEYADCKKADTAACDDTTLVCTPAPYRGGLTRADIEKIKKQYEKKIEKLDKYAKELGPKTLEEIDARDKELAAEREELAKRRKELEKKK